MTEDRRSAAVRQIKEAAKDAIRALPALRVTNTEYVPQLKRRPDQGIDRAAALIAIEHLDLAAYLADEGPDKGLRDRTLESLLRMAAGTGEERGLTDPDLTLIADEPRDVPLLARLAGGEGGENERSDKDGLREAVVQAAQWVAKTGPGSPGYIKAWQDLRHAIANYDNAEYAAQSGEAAGDD